MKTKKQLILIAGLILLSAPAIFAMTPTFSENFGSLAADTAITTGNSNFTFIRTAGTAPYTGSLKAQSTSFGSGSSLVLQSSGYGSTPNITGAGANSLASSDIWSLSVDIKSTLWSTGTYSYIMVGDWNGTSGQQVYNPNGTITTGGFSDTTIGAQSLFALKITGSTSLGGGVLASVGSSGTVTSLSPSTVLANGTAYNLHIVANGSASSISVDGQSIAAGTMGLYLDNTFITSAAIADSVAGTAFRIMSAGNSSGNGQVSIQLDNLQLWNSAVSTIPEPATTAMLGGCIVLLLAATKRKRMRNN